MFNRYGHGSWNSGNMVWERAHQMVCSAMDAVLGFMDAYVQAVREVEESLMSVPVALMVEVLLEALPKPEFLCLLNDFRQLKQELGAALGLFFPCWPPSLLCLAGSSCWISVCSGQSCQLTSSAVAAAAMAPSHPAIAGGSVSALLLKDPQSRILGAQFSNAVCENCKIPGHTKAQCLKPGGNHHKMGPSFNQSYLMDGDIGQDIGGEYEGDADQETEALVANTQAIELDPSVQNGDMSYAVDEEEYNMVSAAYMTEIEAYSAMVVNSGIPHQTPFNAVVDSRCTRHVLNNLFWFHDFTPICLYVGTANSKPLVVHGKSIVKFSVCLTDGTTMAVTLEDCLYAPTCPVNLLSVGALTDVLK
ncbi:hypothetical protein H1R20_g9644, partial [Candolleomyces eurysporus]